MIEWAKMKETNVNERNTLLKHRNSNQNLIVIGKTRLALKGTISSNDVDVTDLNHL